MKPSALAQRLTDEQREQLVADARSLIDQHRAEMEAHFYPKRRRWEREANDDFRDRLSSGNENIPQRIFDLSNDSLNLVRNVTRFMQARTKEDIWGSKPYVGVSPVGALDGPIADQMNRHVPWKLEQAGYGRVGKEAIDVALNLGEAVLKTTNRTDVDHFEKLDLVLAQKSNGKPVIIGLVDETGSPRINPETGEQLGDYIRPEDTSSVDGQPEPTGRLVFDRAPEIAANDPAFEFRQVLVEESRVTYHGPDVAVVPFEGLIAPLNVDDLQKADCVCHEFTRKVSQLREAYADDSDEELDWLFEQLTQEPEGTKTADDKPRDTYGEVANPRGLIANNPPVKVQEVYLRGYDVFGDGVGRNIFLVLAADHDVPLYVEYLANITPRGRTPLHPVVINRVPNRWYGRGFFELYRNSQDLIDALVNAILYRNQNAADPLIAWQPDATLEGRTEPRLIRQPGKTITLRPGKSAKDAIQIVEFPDCDERTWQLVQLIMQLIQTDSGVTSAAQGDYSALPSASTATGVSSILQSASTLHRMLTEDLKDGFEPALHFGVEVIYAYQDADETFRYLEGQAGEVMSLSSAKVLAGLDLRVNLLLDRFQMREQREQAQLIVTQVLPSWVQTLQVSGLPTAGVAAAAQPLYVQIAKGADIHTPEQIFALPQAPPPVILGPDGQPANQPGAAQQPPVDPNAPPALPPPATNVMPSAQPAPATPGGQRAVAAAGQDNQTGGQGDKETSQDSDQGQELDEQTAHKFLHAAGWDNGKARQLARQAGHAV